MKLPELHVVHFCVWNECFMEIMYFQFETSVGPDVYKMRHNGHSPNIVATGGKENELKVYDVQKGEEPVFTSKNVSFLFVFIFIQDKLSAVLNCIS